ncbi:ATP-binding protein [Thermoactinomyces sp. AMNI-1]|uniref:ATP-binding protein n=1 Tax=Thermoactinomyces mirandus TaxID=2756294 RepID=A0A7W2AS70_9BACL|nr:ATP-binding protein [Thermoactinomyces mirandus]
MKICKLTNKVKFPQTKTFEGYSFESITFPESMNPEILKQVDFIGKKENVIMLGTIGIGKTHLSTAMRVEACKQGMKVRFFRASATKSKNNHSNLIHPTKKDRYTFIPA